MGLFDRFKNQEKGQEFFVIAGLGNPGREYAETKHNVGFCVIDRLAEKYHIDVTKFKQKALIGDGTINGKGTAGETPDIYEPQRGKHP